MFRGTQNAFCACVFISVLAAEALANTDQTESRLFSANQTYWVEQIAEGLSFPSSMVWLPDGDMLITERTGGLRIVKGRELNPTPVNGIPATYHQSIVDG